MKFVVAAVFTLALAMGVQSSVIPLISQIAGNGLSYTAVSGPAWGIPGPIAAHLPAAVTIGAWPPQVIAGPSPIVAHAPSVVVGPVGHEGVYTAQTRGAVHTAPLAGHIQSVASINAAPAPGTI